jgi:hypothetical protein
MGGVDGEAVTGQTEQRVLSNKGMLFVLKINYLDKNRIYEW